MPKSSQSPYELAVLRFHDEFYALRTPPVEDRAEGQEQERAAPDTHGSTDTQSSTWEYGQRELKKFAGRLQNEVEPVLVAVGLLFEKMADELESIDLIRAHERNGEELPRHLANLRLVFFPEPDAQQPRSRSNGFASPTAVASIMNPVAAMPHPASVVTSGN